VQRPFVSVFLAVLIFVAGGLLGYRVGSRQAPRLLPPTAEGPADAPPTSQGEAAASGEASPTAPVAAPDPVMYSLDGSGGLPDEGQILDRVKVFERPYRVMSAAVYKVHDNGIVEDVYMVFNNVDGQTEAHLIGWYEPDGEAWCKWHLRQAVTPLTSSDEMLVLDLDGDGTREVISYLNGANIHSPQIIDFDQLSGERDVLDGIEAFQYGSTYEFQDLDGDGDFECIATTHGPRDLECLGVEFEEAGVAYITHEIRDAHYVRTQVSTTRPEKSW